MRTKLLAILIAASLALVGPLIGVSSAAPVSSPSEAAEFVNALNGIRASKGLPALVVHSGIQASALEWTFVMHSQGYISHTTDLSDGAPAGWQKLGENVGRGGSVSGLVNAFVASSGHYANIVDPKYTHIGVGVVRDGNTLYTTHRFLAYPQGLTSTAPAPTTTTTTTQPPANLAFTTPTNRTPIGNVDAAVAVGTRIRVAGWGFDEDKKSANLWVYVTVDGVTVAKRKADTGRSDVGAYFNIANNHGFDVTVPSTFGTHQVCTYLVDANVTTQFTTLPCRTVTIDASASSPTGNFEAASRTKSDTVTVKGWALDPDVLSSPATLHVYVDGRLVSIRKADVKRPDVGAVFNTDPYHGFKTDIPVGPGGHEVCVYAINVGPGTTNPQLGCKRV